MASNQINKEALFNEVKGSLFEYLMARELALMAGDELAFIESLDKNYLNILGQQDRMVRQFYPEMLSFLNHVAKESTKKLVRHLGEIPLAPQLRGKFSNSSISADIHEADLILQTSQGEVPLSLKLNKKNAFVNTKSGGIKSFFTTYFSYIDQEIQREFNLFVDQEFLRMSFELHELNDLEYPGDYSLWVRAGKSELPGELSQEERQILKSFYARVASRMHQILTDAKKRSESSFAQSLLPLMGFSSSKILQLVCFHEFKSNAAEDILIHSYSEIENLINQNEILPFHHISSVEMRLGHAELQIRVKPMNKFTTTAIKINCSVKFKRSDDV